MRLTCRICRLGARLFTKTWSIRCRVMRVDLDRILRKRASRKVDLKLVMIRSIEVQRLLKIIMLKLDDKKSI